jgi:predicted ester cyclase
MSVERNKETIRRLVEFFNARHFDRLDQVCHEQIVYRTGSGIELQGLPTYRGMMEQLHQGFPDFRYDLQEMVGEGDRVHWTYRYTGTHTGDFMGLAAKEGEADYLVAAACRFKDGKIIDHFDVYDGLTFLRQTGVVSQEVRPGGEEWPSGGRELRLH